MTPKQLAALPLGTHPIKQHPGLRLEVRGSVRTWTLRRRDPEGNLGVQLVRRRARITEAVAAIKDSCVKPCVLEKLQALFEPLDVCLGQAFNWIAKINRLRMAWHAVLPD
jgi:hypothetical protein